MATRTSALEASVDTPTTGLLARVTTEENARASGDSALASRATALETSVNTPTTGLLARVTTTESAISTNTSAISSISSELTAAREGETNLLAKINVIEAAYVAGDTAVAGTVTSLTSTVTGKITTFRQTSAPTATAIGDIWIDTDDSNKLYRASATGSGSWVAVDDARIATLVSDLDTAEATIVTNTANISTNSSAISTLNGSVSTVQSEVTAARSGEASLSARIGTVSTAATNAAGAASTAQSEITAARQGEASLTAKVTALSTATSTVDGKLSASYGLTVDANGRIASMKLLSNGTTSSVKFTASTFQIYNGATDEAPFEVTGGVVKIKTANIGNINADTINAGTLNVDRINAGSIITAKLEANAVSQGVSGETDAAVDVLSTSWVTLESESITVPDATTLVKVDWSFFVGVSGEPEDDLLVRIKRGSTVIYETTAARVPAPFSFYTEETGQMDFYQTFTGQVSGFDADTPGAAGTYTYTLEAKADLSTIGPWSLSRRRLFLMQFKR